MTPFIGSAQYSEAVLWGGISSPFGSYSKLSPDSKGAGYAEPGAYAEAGVVFRDSKNFGIVASLAYFENLLNGEAIEQYYSGEEWANLYVDHGTNWRNYSVLIGAIMEVPFGAKKKSSICLDGRLGYLHSVKPEIKVHRTFENSTVGETIISHGGASGSPAYSIKAFFNQRFGKFYSLKLGLGLLGGVQSYRTETISRFSLTEDFLAYPIHVLNYQLGLGFRFH